MCDQGSFLVHSGQAQADVAGGFGLFTLVHCKRSCQLGFKCTTYVGNSVTPTISVREQTNENDEKAQEPR